MMRIFLVNIMLSIAWAALLGEFSTVNMISGFVVGYFMLWLMESILGTTSYSKKLWQVITFGAYFTKELIIANLRVAYSVLAPNSQMRPGIAAIPLDIESDAEITMLANLITLTPGTLSLDVSDDRKVLYVHGMHIYDLEAFKQEIKNGFERKVREVFE